MYSKENEKNSQALWEKNYANTLSGKKYLFPVNSYNLGRQQPTGAKACDSGWGSKFSSASNNSYYS